MKKTATIATIILVSIGGAVTYLNRPITEVSQIPNTPVVGIFITQTASVRSVKAVLDEVEKRGQTLYVAADSRVSDAVKKEMKKHSYASETYRIYPTTEEPIAHLGELIKASSGRSDYAILSI